MAAGDRGGRGRGTYGDRGQRDRGTSRRDGRSGEDKGKDKDKDTSTPKDSPGPIGGADSYGMDKDSFDKSIGRDSTPKGSGGDKGVIDKVGDFVNNTIKDIGNWFKGEEDTGGFSPMGGPSSYGMEKKTFDRTIGARRHAARSLDQRLLREVDYFREAPMDYAADLLRNPIVAGGVAMSGLGMTAFGVQAVDAVMDMVQNETTPMGAVSATLRSAIQNTPVGAALGPVKSVATAALDSPEKAVGATGALLGTQIAGRAGVTVADALTDNPLAKAAITAGTAAAGGWAGRTALTGGFGGNPMGKAVTGMQSPDTSSDDKRTSPLVSAGKAAVEAHSKLAEQAQQPVDLYARTVNQLPYYGLAYNPKQQQLPYYGV